MSKIIKDLPAEQYHAMKDVLSNSMLSHFLTSPAHLQTYLKEPHAQTPAQALGSLCHTCILEPLTLSREYVVAPKFDRRTKDGKAAAEAFETANARLKSITQETHDDVQRMIEAVYSHDSASALLADAMIESSVFWTDEKTGVKCRARPDAYRDGILIDLKTTRDARPKAFQRSLYEYGYYRQMAFYSAGLRANGLPVERHIIIAVETSAPYGLRVYELEKSAISYGELEIRDAMDRYAECMKSDLWPAYTQEIELLGLPAYA